MTEQDFDRHVKEVLQNLEAPYAPESWELLQRRMEAATGGVLSHEEAQLRHQLEQLSEPYPPEGWQLLYAKMRQRAQRRAAVYAAKAVEIALLILLLLWHFDGKESAYPKTAGPVANYSARPKGDMGQLSEITLRKENAEPSASPTMQPSAREGGAIPDHYSSQSSLRPGAQASISALDEPQEIDISHKIAPAHWAQMEPLPCSAPSLLHRGQTATDLPKAVSPAPTTTGRTQQHFYLLAGAAFHTGRVHFAEGKTQASAGYGAALRMERRKRHWAVGFGLEYTVLAFAPVYQEQLLQGNPHTGYYGIRMPQVSADVLALPLTVSRRFLNTPRWQGWATGGLSTHLALSKSYDYDYTYHAPGTLPPTQIDPNAQPPLRERGLGLLEGGGGASNIWLSADAGIRFEYQWTQGRYAGFLQPSYRHGLSPSIGPGRPHLHVWSLQAGVRIGL